MKILKKIKLINWHGYVNETVEINKNVLITGRTGAGKSTLVDAICFIIGGGRIKFNQSARDRGNRTVETYMRGSLSDKEWLRSESNIISHIQLEFFDEYNKSSFLLGCVFELYEQYAKADQNFYCINNCSMENDMFFDNKSNNIRSYKYMEKYCQEHNFDINKFNGTKTEIRKSIGIRLGLENEKYFELLPKAIAFRADYSLEQLIFEFLLPKNDVDLENIIDTIREYESYRDNIEDSKNRITILEKINDAYQEYVYNNDCIDKLEILKIQIALQNSKNEKNTNINKLENLNSLQIVNEQEKENIEKRIDEVKEMIINIRADGRMIQFNYINEKINECRNDLKIVHGKMKQFKNDVDFECNIAKQLELNFPYCKLENESDFEKFQIKLKEYNSALELKFKNLFTEQNDINNCKNSIESELNELIERQKKLKQGAPVLKDEVTNLIDVIKEEVYKKSGDRITPIPFCNLIEIKEGEEEWRNALEGYLNTKRFDIFVPEQYYDVALMAYEKYKKDKKIFGVGLVNTAKLVNIEAEINSLATKLQTDDVRAQKYVDFLLGHIICVSNEQELKNFNSAITKSVMVYKNKAARQTKSDIWKTPYIGSKSISIQLVQVEYDITLKTKLRVEYINRLNEIREQIELKDHSIRSKLQTSQNYWKEENDVENILQNYIEDKNALDTSDLEEQINNFERYEKEKLVLFEKQDKCKEKEKTIIKGINTIEIDISRNNENISKLEESLAKLVDNNSKMIGHENFVQKYSNISNIAKEIENYRKKNDNCKDLILTTMQEYFVKYQYEERVCMDNVDLYLREFNKLNTYDLPKFENKAKEVLVQAKRDFQEKYIVLIRKHILTEKRNIDELNKLLKIQPFGETEEKYKIIIEKSDVDEYGKFYDIFMSEENYECNTLFDDRLSEANKALLDSLFDNLTIYHDYEKGKAILRKYIDYRNFMKYDIEITDKNGTKYRYQDVVGGKSGGENQNPFYVIIAAAFNRISSRENNRRSKSSACLVFLDEAFDKMDAPRVKSMIQYFNKLEIQVMIAVPENKDRAIFPSIDTKIVVVKDNNVMKIRSHVKE